VIHFGKLFLDFFLLFYCVKQTIIDMPFVARSPCVNWLANNISVWFMLDWSISKPSLLFHIYLFFLFVLVDSHDSYTQFINTCYLISWTPQNLLLSSVHWRLLWKQSAVSLMRALLSLRPMLTQLWMSWHPRRVDMLVYCVPLVCTWFEHPSMF